MKKIITRFLIIIGIIVCLLISIFVVAPQLPAVALMRWQSRAHPQAYLIPEGRQPTIFNANDSLNFTIPEASYGVPWKNFEVIKQDSSHLVLKLPDKALVSFVVIKNLRDTIDSSGYVGKIL